jgi:hypothetical protein
LIAKKLRDLELKATFRFRAFVPLNFLRVQNFTAAEPSGSPWVVTAKLECIRTPQTV